MTAMATHASAPHYGTLGLTDQRNLRLGYDVVADHMWMEPRFYHWMAQQLVADRVPRGASVLDVGCGNGNMLSALADVRFRALSGIDFSLRCVTNTRRAVSDAQVWQQDVLDGPLPQHDVITMTEVIEHVRDPVAALLNVGASLGEHGRLYLSFPNRLAYWPWLYLNPLRRLVPSGLARLRSIVDYLTVPYEMRSTQPIDHAYCVSDVRRFLAEAGLHIEREDGLVLWPMLRVRPWLSPVFDALEDTVGRMIPRQACYRYLFVCRTMAPAP
jgi:SAM-dependent methyltransferase